MNTKKQKVLEAELQSKIAAFADKDVDYEQKWAALDSDRKAFEARKAEKDAQLEQLRQEYEAENLKAQQARRAVEEKEKRLEEERDKTRREKSALESSFEAKIKEVEASGSTKLLLVAGVCLFLGLVLA